MKSLRPDGDVPKSPMAALLVASAFLVSPNGFGADSRDGGRFCFAANVGSSFVQDVYLTSFDDYESGTIRFDPGGRFDFEAGYRVWNALTVGIESGFLFNETVLTGEPGWKAEGRLYQIPLLANVIFQPDTGTRFHPFVGGGLGAVRSTMESRNSFLDESDYALGFAWQATAGCRYELKRGMDLGLAYKYLGTTARTFEELEVRLDGTRTHSVLLSFSIQF